MLIKCRVCKEEIDVPITKSQEGNWLAGVMLQDAAPNLTPGQRELLISHTCEPCFDRMWLEE